MARNLDRKQLKTPDQFIGFWTRVGVAVGARKREMLVGTIALFVVIAGGWVGGVFLAKKQAQAAEAFGRIARIAGAALIPATGESKFEDALPHFKTDQERFEAALKEADTFLATHSGSKLADEARLLRARYLMALDKPKDALSAYEQLLAGSVDPKLRFLAQEGLGYAHEATGQIDKAVGAFDALATSAQSEGGFYRDRALFNKARLLDKQGKAKEAEPLYREILDKTPTSPLREQINDRLAAASDK